MYQSHWARLEACEAQLGGHGQVIVIVWHACQAEASVEDMARRQLGRPWRRQDLLVMVARDDCPPGPHRHDDQQVIIHQRQ